MPHFKNTNNELFWLDAGDDPANWIPGCVQISDAEAETIKASKIILPTYQELRAAEYPSVSDYLDGVVKGDTEQIQQYIDRCLAVKEKYPKVAK